MDPNADRYRMNIGRRNDGGEDGNRTEGERKGMMGGILEEEKMGIEQNKRRGILERKGRRGEEYWMEKEIDGRGIEENRRERKRRKSIV